MTIEDRKKEIKEICDKYGIPTTIKLEEVKND